MISMPDTQTHTSHHVAIVFPSIGPYHIARLTATAALLQKHQIHFSMVQISASTETYNWKSEIPGTLPVTSLSTAIEERSHSAIIFYRFIRFLRARKISLVFLPSYSPLRNLALLLAAKLCSVRIVIMSESHEGTACKSSLVVLFKRFILSLSDYMLVGGTPHKRYYSTLGVPPARIFTGYDVVDNMFYGSTSLRLLGGTPIENADCVLSTLPRIPSHFFLSVGRFVSKKNLFVLIDAFNLYSEILRHLNSPSFGPMRHLCLVGSGALYNSLRAYASALNLVVHDHETDNIFSFADRTSTASISDSQPVIHFYGFRQAQENALFYSKCDAFILPSLYEEWGLVVNEAMASGAPTIISNTAGCCEDLLQYSISELPDFFDAVQPAIDALQLPRSSFEYSNYSNGFSFDPNSFQQLALCMLSLVYAPSAVDAHSSYATAFKTKMDLCRQSARQIISQYSCETFAAQVLKICNSVNAQ